MKNIPTVVLLFVVCLCMCSATKYSEPKDFAGLDIKGFIEKLLDDLKSKLPHELTFSDKNIVIPTFLEEYVMGKIDLSNITFTGLKDFNMTIQYLPILPIPKKYLLTIKDLSLHMNYKSDIILYGSKYLSVFGEDTATITLRNLQVGGDISVTMFPMGAEVNVDIDWDGFTFEMLGLLGDEAFSTQVSQIAGNAITKVSEGFKKPLSFIFKSITNFVVKLMMPHASHSLKIENDEVLKGGNTSDLIYVKEMN